MTPGSQRPDLDFRSDFEPIPAAGLIDLLLFFCRRRLLLRIEGQSMLPTLHAGDRVLVKPLQKNLGQLQPGMVVVSWHPNKPGLRLVKRLAACSADGLTLMGDNPAASTDSRQLGIIPAALLIGVVVGRLQPRSQNSNGCLLQPDHPGED